MAFDTFKKKNGITETKPASTEAFGGFKEKYNVTSTKKIVAPAPIAEPKVAPKSNKFADVASAIGKGFGKVTTYIEKKTDSLNDFSHYEKTVGKPNIFRDTLREIGSLETLPFGVGEIIKQARQDPDSVAALSTKDFGVGAFETGKELLKFPIDAGLTVTAGLIAPVLEMFGKKTDGGQVRFNIPGLGEVSNLQARAAERADAGEPTWQIAVTSAPDAIFDTLFFLGVSQKLFSPRPVTIMKGEVPPESGITVKEPPKSFRHYTEPQATAPLPPGALEKIAQQKGFDISPDYNPSLPTYFRMRGQANGVITGEIVQVRPSYFSTFMEKFKSDITKVPPEGVVPLYSQQTSVQAIARAKPVATEAPVVPAQTGFVETLKAVEAAAPVETVNGQKVVNVGELPETPINESPDSIPQELKAYDTVDEFVKQKTSDELTKISTEIKDGFSKYLPEGISEEIVQKNSNAFFKALVDGDNRKIAEYLNPNNKAFNKIFTDLTGLKVGKDITRQELSESSNSFIADILVSRGVTKAKLTEAYNKPADRVESQLDTSAPKVGEAISFGGKQMTVESVILPKKVGGDARFELITPDGSSLYVDAASILSERRAAIRGITTSQLLKEHNALPREERIAQLKAQTLEEDALVEDLIAQSKSPTQKERVAQSVKEEAKSIKEIAAETKIKEPNVRRILGVGAKEGTFERVAEGVYKLSVGGQDLAFVEVGSAMEVLPRLASEGFKADMVFLDIPYDLAGNKGGNRMNKKKDTLFETISVSEFEQVIKSVNTILRDENKYLIHMISQSKTSAKGAEVYTQKIIDAGFKPLAKGDYYKMSSKGTRLTMPMRSDFLPPEGILIFNKSGKMNVEDFKNLEFKLVRPRGYQTEKPAELLKSLIEMTTKEGDTILDPFAGSGVTGAEAVKVGRKAYLIERDGQVAQDVIMPRLERSIAPTKKTTAKERIEEVTDIFGSENAPVTKPRKGEPDVIAPLFRRGDLATIVSANKEFASSPVLTVDEDKMLTFKGKNTAFKIKPEAMGLNPDKIEVGEKISVDVPALKKKGADQRLRVFRGDSISGEAMAQLSPNDVPQLSGEFGGINNIKPVQMPELVRITRELLGKFPEIVKSMGNAGGRFYHDGRIKLIASLFNAPNTAVNMAGRFLAHELGHLIDYLPDNTLKRGNLLGRLETLRNFVASTFSKIEGGALDLGKLRNGAMMEVIKKHDLTFKDYISDKETRERLKDEIQEVYQDKIDATDAIRNSVVRRELLAVTRYWHPYDAATSPAGYVKYRESSKELYADALSVMFNDPAMLEKMAPTFYKEFFNALDAKPNVKEAFFTTQALLNGTPEEIFKARAADIRNGFERAEAIQAGFRDKAKLAVKSLWEQFRQQVDDVNYPILKKQAEAEAAGKIFSDEESPKFLLQESSMADNENFLLVEEIQKSVVEPLKNAGMTLGDIGEYLLLDRIRTGRAEIANPFGFTAENAVEQLNFLEERLGEKDFALLKQKVQSFHNLIFPSVEEAVRVGSYNSDTFIETILPNKDNYAAFQVVDYMQERMPASIKAQVGTLKEVANPFTSTVLKTIALNRLNAYQRAKNGTIKMLQENFPAEISETRRITSDGKLAIFRPAEGKGGLEVLENGRMQSYDVDPYIAESFNTMSAGELNVVVALADKFNNKLFKPLVTTFNLGFAIGTNPIRDFKRNYKMIPNATVFNLLKAYGSSIGQSFQYSKGNLDEFTRSLVQSKAINAPINDYSFDPVDTQFGAILEKYGLVQKLAEPFTNPVLESLRKTVTKPTIQLLEGIRFLANTFEIVSKISGAKVRIAGGDEGSRLAHNLRNFTGTPNFRVKGSQTKTTNALFVFSNIMKESLKSDLKIASDPNTRSGYWWKTIKIDLMPKFLMFLASAGVFGKVIKDIMDKATEYDKTNYLIIPFGETDTGKAVYMRVPHDETGRLVSAVFWKMASFIKDGGNVKDLHQIFALGAGQFPSITPIFNIFVNWGLYLSGKNPYDTFRGRSIIDDTTWQAGGGPALKKMVQWTLSDLGLAKFSTYDDSQQTGLETFMQVAPWFSSLFKITDYGEQEKLKEVRDEQKQVEAKDLLEERALLTEYVQKAQEDPQNAVTYLSEMTTEMLGGQPQTIDDLNRVQKVTKKFLKEVLTGVVDDPRAKVIQSATSNAQKVKILQEVRKEMTPEEFNAFIGELSSDGLLSADAITKLLTSQ